MMEDMHADKTCEEVLVLHCLSNDPLNDGLFLVFQSKGTLRTKQGPIFNWQQCITSIDKRSFFQCCKLTLNFVIDFRCRQRPSNCVIVPLPKTKTFGNDPTPCGGLTQPDPFLLL